MINSFEHSLEAVRRKMIFNFSMVLIAIATILVVVIFGFYQLEKQEFSSELQHEYLNKLQPSEASTKVASEIIANVTQTVADSQNTILRDNLSILFGVLFVLSAMPSFLISQSIARKKIYALKRKHYAYFDDLTELPSCNMLIDRLNHIFAQSRRYNHKFSILYMNVDNFSEVNNSWGKQIGDRVLKVIAERLVAAVRNSDTVSYIGDDEFAIILSVVSEKNDAEIVANKIIQKMGHPFKHNDEEKYLGMSIGIATYPDDGIDTETLMTKSDQAMIRVKNTIKNGFLHSE